MYTLVVGSLQVAISAQEAARLYREEREAMGIPPFIASHLWEPVCCLELLYSYPGTGAAVLIHDCPDNATARRRLTQAAETTGIIAQLSDGTTIRGTTLPPTYAATIETQIPDEIPMSPADVPPARDDNGQEEDTMDRVSYIHVTDDPTAWFAEGADLAGIDERASIERGRELITEALRQAFPAADIWITEGYAIDRITWETDIEDPDEASDFVAAHRHITNEIDHIIHETWESHGWIVYADQEDEPEA